MCKGYFLIILLFIVSSFASLGQNKAELQQKKQQTLKKINEAEKILKQTTTQKKNTLGQLSALNQQIKTRRELMSAIESEIGLLDSEIGEIDLLYDALDSDLENLKEEYAQMIYGLSKNSSSYGKLAFLFSAESFNQFVRRMEYLQQYSEARKSQVNQIQTVQELLKENRLSKQTKRVEQEILLNEQIAENEKLETLKDKQSSVIAELGKKENLLIAEIEKNKRAAVEISNLIDKLIAAEASKSSDTRMENTPEGKILSASFAENKNRLPWPVSQGFISQGFGEQKHPVLKQVVIKNNGVNIQTQADESVRVVFDGIVTFEGSVRDMAGSVVIIQHGEYRTVYTNIKNVSVKRGDKVKAGQSIGQVYTNSDGLSEIKFQVRHGAQVLNPEIWLTKK
ncbi:murein hydrolase activator EnvC family protein [Marinigracilibium pacificum]|uniref:Peptidoglycan DD-metalloendopeptidase family protein n=1 Tax=Marinigracilibium pacificum TaxID=2729599 RepID=A0A848J2E6_9BACT|nr:peptidoglycan DD-metalloendopeptidase family protein [Marinigracilibium pacificum]NMM48654.1 peptidoglycan DD-metalloendopeptidase family protein [Marinigracilibium pacificum]